jgi:hypothetical protein
MLGVDAGSGAGVVAAVVDDTSSEMVTVAVAGAVGLASVCGTGAGESALGVMATWGMREGRFAVGMSEIACCDPTAADFAACSGLELEAADSNVEFVKERGADIAICASGAMALTGSSTPGKTG